MSSTTATATGGTFNPSYGQGPGGYDYNGTSDNPGAATGYFSTLQQAEANWFASNPGYAQYNGANAGGVANDTAGGTIASNTPVDAILGVGASGGGSTPAGTAPAADPFTQLTNLLGSLASAGAGGSVPASTNTPTQAVPTQGGPSLVIPLMLLVLAIGLGYWYFKKHHGAHAGHSEHGE